MGTWWHHQDHIHKNMGDLGIEKKKKVNKNEKKNSGSIASRNLLHHLANLADLRTGVKDSSGAPVSPTGSCSALLFRELLPLEGTLSSASSSAVEFSNSFSCVTSTVTFFGRPRRLGSGCSSTASFPLLCDKFELSESTFVDAAAAARCLGEKYDVILLPTVFEALSLGAAVS